MVNFGACLLSAAKEGMAARASKTKPRSKGQKSAKTATKTKAKKKATKKATKKKSTGRSKRARSSSKGEGDRRRRRDSAAPPAPSEPDGRSAHGEAPDGAQQHTAAIARRLDTILRALPEGELRALIERMSIRIDPKKRIDTPAQVARALVRVPEIRDTGRLPSASAELLRRVAEAGGSLVVGALPAGLEPLVRHGMLYACMADPGIELMLPTALLVQLGSWEGEDPRCLRALLSEAPFETASAIASHYLGRPSTPPIALSLEPAWEVLGNPAALRAEVERVSHQERRLLDALEQVGGEVDTQELMDLERQPMRVRGAYGVAAGRRGAAFSLEKRGLLFPMHPNRYVIPTEVAAIIGAERRAQREQSRNEIRSHVIEEDHLPRRARFSTPSGPLSIALVLALRELDTEVRQGVGTPRSLVSRLAQRFGRSGQNVALVAALSRASGLWDRRVSPAAPPGSLSVHQLSRLMFDTWRRGGAWDEARPDAEMLRVAPEHRDPSPVGVLREMVLEALQDLGEDQWVPYSALEAYLGDDPRAGGLERLFYRWSGRVGLAQPSQEEVARRILLESLPALGAVDIGGAEGDPTDGEDVALRLTARGRRYIAPDQGPARPLADSEFVDGRSLRVSASARVADVIALGPFADLGAVDKHLELSLSAAALSRGLARGVEADEMRARLTAVAELSGELDRALKEAGTVVGRGTVVAAGGFVWIEDADVRAMLSAHGPTAELFVDPSPTGGLLVAPGVELERLVRRCRALGVELETDASGGAMRTASTPPPRGDDGGRRVSWRPPTTRKRRTGSR
jgi:hypothetical protein